MIYETPRFLPGGDSALFIELGDAIDPELNRRVRRMHLAIEEAGLTGVVEVVPAYCSLLVYYEPRRTNREDLVAALDLLSRTAEEREFPQPMITEVPTAYGGEHGQDLDFVARHNGLSAEEVVHLHAGRDYLIYMLGFIPGFPYLGGMSPRISTPRLATPRAKIPTGSVGIAGNQTGIYPEESPGGWRLIGRTPLKLFHPDNKPPALLQMGDYVRFLPITESEFRLIGEQLERGTHRLKQYPVTRRANNEGD